MTKLKREAKKVLIFGANGRLAGRLCPYLRSAGYQVLMTGRAKNIECAIDVLNPFAVKELFDSERPDHVINLIAATDVDECEIDSARAIEANTLVPSIISRAARASECRNIHFVQISTDQVYGGSGNHIEDDVAPVNVYGLTKLAGEFLTDPKNATVLRTNFFGKNPPSVRPAFSDWVVASLVNRKEITVLRDVVFSALHVSTLCSVIEEVLSARLLGTYNVGSRNGISKAEFALLLARGLDLPIDNVKVGITSDLGFKAKRPKDMTMDVGKLEKALGIRCPYISDEISKTIEDYVGE